MLYKGNGNYLTFSKGSLERGSISSDLFGRLTLEELGINGDRGLPGEPEGPDSLGEFDKRFRIWPRRRATGFFRRWNLFLGLGDMVV